MSECWWSKAQIVQQKRDWLWIDGVRLCVCVCACACVCVRAIERKRERGRERETESSLNEETASQVLTIKVMLGYLPFLLGVNTCTHTPKYCYEHTNSHTHTCMYAHTQVLLCTHQHTYTHIHTHTHSCTHTRTQDLFKQSGSERILNAHMDLSMRWVSKTLTNEKWLEYLHCEALMLICVTWDRIRTLDTFFTLCSST